MAKYFRTQKLRLSKVYETTFLVHKNLRHTKTIHAIFVRLGQVGETIKAIQND